MINSIRLDTISPTLGDHFWKASREKRREAAFVSCEVACKESGLDAPIIIDALSAIFSENAKKEYLRKEIAKIVSDYDERYLGLANMNESELAQSLEFFSKARAATAILSALVDDDALLHEAIYESLASVREPSILVNQIDQILV